MKKYLRKLGSKVLKLAKLIFRLLKHFALTFIIILLFLCILTFVRIDRLARTISEQELPYSNGRILDRNGEILYEKLYEDERYFEYVQLDNISEYVKETVLAVEDKNFYKNKGGDILRTAKCLVLTVFTNNNCGGSTITQQYVKLRLENVNQRNILNKLVETLVAIRINHYLTKDQILERYLNEIYYGNFNYGIEIASKNYLGKPSSELSLAQSVFLSIIPRAPARYNPYLKPENAKKRKTEILNYLLEEGVIKNEEYETAIAEEIDVIPKVSNMFAPHVVDIALYAEGEDIKTSIDLDLHNKIKAVVEENIKQLENLDLSNTAVVVLDAPTGEVLAMVGSKGYFGDSADGKVNVAIMPRQPGSTLKPFIYGLALSTDMTAATLINDKEHPFPDGDEPYFPRNFDMDEHGYITVRKSLANSYNIPAVMTLQHIGISQFYSLTDRVGLPEIKSQEPNLSAALGSASISLLDLSNAYRTFPNSGNYLGSSILFFDDVEKEAQEKTRVNNVFGNNSEGVSYIISDILADNDARRESFGSRSNLVLPFQASVKTGTSTNFRDSWAIGYTKQFVVGVWAGNNDNSSVDGVTGAQGAGMIWHDTMEVVYDYYLKNRNLTSDDFWFEKPYNVKDFSICKEKASLYDKVNCETLSYEELFLEEILPDSPKTVRILDINKAIHYGEE